MTDILAALESDNNRLRDERNTWSDRADELERQNTELRQELTDLIFMIRHTPLVHDGYPSGDCLEGCRACRLTARIG